MTKTSSSAVAPPTAATAVAGGVPDFVGDLKRQSTTSLRDLLVEQMSLTAGHLLRLSWIIRVLEERGEDLSDLRLSILPYLRLIAYGQILPEVVVRFAAYPLLLGKVSTLAEPDQRRLANGENVRLVVPIVAATTSPTEQQQSQQQQQLYTHRMVDPTKLTGEQIRQVFGKVGLRSDAEQISILDTKRANPKTLSQRDVPPKRGKVRADRQRKGVVVNRTFVQLADVLEAVGDLQAKTPASSSDEELPSGIPVSVPLSEEEHRALKVLAAQSDSTIGQLVRNALRTAGLV